MKQWKRVEGTVLSGVLALSMVLGSTAGTVSEAKAKKAALKTKTITVKVRKTKKIVFKSKRKNAKYTFSSNKKKIASVSKKGVVKGVKKGKAVITVKEVFQKKKKTLGKVKVTVTKADSKKTILPTPTVSPVSSPAPTANVTPVATPTATIPATVVIPTPSSGPTETKKIIGKNNPIATQRYMADPYAIEFEGRVYVYGTNDSQSMVIGADGKIPENKYSNINTLNCYSTSDMVNWRDEGIIQVAGKNGPASWAKNSWAPAVAHKKIDGKDKFFIYFADNGSGIGVLEGDSPTGPWRDPIGKQLISRDTPNCGGAEVPWLFDPAVLVDDDGQGYLYFGGIGEAEDREHPNCIRVVKLTDNMIGLKEEPQVIDAPAPFEDSGINKFNDKYYYSYCTNWDGSDKRPTTSNLGVATIAYMVSDTPMGPWSEAKVVLKNPTYYFSKLPNNDKNNNHHCMFEKDGQIYMFYHSQKMAADKGITQGYRTSGVDLVQMDANGNLTSKMTLKGVEQVGAFNPYEVVEAETFAWSEGTSTTEGPKQNNTRSNRVLSSIHRGDYVGLEGVEFGATAPKHVAVKLASETGKKVEGKIYVYQNEISNECQIAEIPVSVDKDFKYISAELTKSCTGKQKVFFVFDVEGILVDTWTFTKEASFTAPTE